MNRNHFKYDETKLRPLQREAAIALVEYEFTPKSERKTLEEIAKEIGVTRKTIHQWNTRDANFIAFKNSMAADFMDTHLSFVYKKLVDSIERGSVKGIELYLKRIGDLDTHTEVTLKNVDEQSFEDRKRALLDRINRVEDEAEGV